MVRRRRIADLLIMGMCLQCAWIHGKTAQADIIEDFTMYGRTGVYAGQEAKEEGASVSSPHCHIWSEEWARDDTCHWHECTVADHDAADSEKEGYAPHDFGGWTQVKKPTCTRAGRRVRTCSVCGWSETKAIPAAGHRYGKAVYTWAVDRSTVTAERICAADKRHVEKETVKVKSQVAKATTAEEKGVRTYTSGFFENNAFAVQTKTEVIPKLGRRKGSAKRKAVDLTGKGSRVTSGNMRYIVTRTGDTDGEAAFKKPVDSEETIVTIPAIIKVDGVICKVTSVEEGAFTEDIGLKKVVIGENVTEIGRKAFYGCRNLKKITVTSAKLGKVGDLAVKGIHKKAVIQVPKEMYFRYRKKFAGKAGYGSTVDILPDELYEGELPELPEKCCFEEGDRDDQVGYLQKFLNWYGDYELLVNGEFDAETVKAVKEFQRKEGLEVDGSFGPESLERAAEMVH